MLTLADSVAPTLTVFRWLCYLVLAFYCIRVFASIFIGHDGQGSQKLREAMATAYTILAAVCIFLATRAVQPFVANIVETAGLVYTPSALVNFLFVLCGGFVCVAFLCNFSRSLWMLKSLDHGIFEPVPDWDRLAGSTGKRAVEFLTRTFAAVFFIGVELQLERLASVSAAENVSLLARGREPHSFLTNAGALGMWLYGFLLLWWLSGLWIARSQMPKRLLVFYILGLMNSGFIFFFAGKTASPDRAFIMIFVVGGMGVSALYMLGIVLEDIGRFLWSTAKEMFRLGRGGSQLEPRVK